MIDLTKIPIDPGCYLFKDKNRIIIYIGKAKSLKKRVSSYFSKKHDDPKTEILVSLIESIDFIATKNEVEALILENNLIKKHNPKYNISLKDAKRYAYLEITGEEFPRLIIARSTQPTTKGGKLYGPFVSGAARAELSEFLIRTLKIRTCRTLPKKVCLRYHIGLCPAPCIGAISKQEYETNISLAQHILEGKTHQVTSRVKEEMQTYSKSKEYEKSLASKKVIDALEWLTEKQNMERQILYDEDIINYAVVEDMVYLLLFHVKQGILEQKKEFTFQKIEHFLEEFIVQYYSENPIPKELILPVCQEKSLELFLSKKRGNKVKIIVPKIGEKKQLLDLVAKNIELSFFAEEQKLNGLKELLNLENIPLVIECFDISHLSGTSTVASMVQFRNAKPNKENYRRFKIKSVEGVDDFASIKEVVYRRYYKHVQEHLALPDLVIIDGGKGQLSSALESLKQLQITIPIIGLAKENEDIFVPGEGSPLQTDKKNNALQLLRAIRDEAHRFAITYNKLLRKKQMLEQE